VQVEPADLPMVAGCRGTKETYHSWKAVAKHFEGMMAWTYA